MSATGIQRWAVKGLICVSYAYRLFFFSYVTVGFIFGPVCNSTPTRNFSTHWLLLLVVANVNSPRERIISYLTKMIYSRDHPTMISFGPRFEFLLIIFIFIFFSLTLMWSVRVPFMGILLKINCHAICHKQPRNNS